MGIPNHELVSVNLPYYVRTLFQSRQSDLGQNYNRHFKRDSVPTDLRRDLPPRQFPRALIVHEAYIEAYCPLAKNL
jgi:hypothetical protein